MTSAGYTREMTEADLDVVLAMENELQVHPWPRSAFEQALRLKQDCRVYVEEEKITGYGVGDKGHGRTIAARTVQGATALYQCWLAAAEAAHAVLLWAEVEPENTAAIRRLKRFGFSHIGDRAHFYGVGCPAQVWARSVAKDLPNTPSEPEDEKIS